MSTSLRFALGAVLAVASCRPAPPALVADAGAPAPADPLLRLPADRVVATFRGGAIRYGELDRSVDGELARLFAKKLTGIRYIEPTFIQEHVGAVADLVIDLPPASEAPGPDEHMRVPPGRVVARWRGGQLTYGELDAGRHEAMRSLYRNGLNQVWHAELGALDALLRERLLEVRVRESQRGLEDEWDLLVASPDVTDADARAFHAKHLATTGAPFTDEITALLAGSRRARAEASADDALRRAYDAHVVLPPPAVTRAPFGLEGRPRLGPASAAITLVEMTDLACTSCGTVGELRALEARMSGRLAIVFLHLPAAFDPTSGPAAVAAECAHAQGKFWQYRVHLEAEPGPRTVGALTRAAAAVPLDLAAFHACRASPATQAQVDRDLEQADIFGARSIPSFFVDGLPGPARVPTADEVERLAGAGSPTR